jgi:microcystin-dependent protein
MNQGALSGLKPSSWVPSGVVWEYVGAAVPDGWLLCDGSAISRAQYPELFRVLGTQYGAGDGNKTFNLPNRKGKVGIGLDTGQTEFNALGLTGGFKDKIASHSHDMASHTHFRSAAGVGGSTGGALGNSAQYVVWTGGRGGASADHSHPVGTTGLGGNHGDGFQGYAAGDNHQCVQTTDQTGEATYSNATTGRNTVHAHGLIDHRHALENHAHDCAGHTHADTFGNPSPNATGESSQVAPSQATSGNLQPYVVTNFIVKV